MLSHLDPALRADLAAYVARVYQPDRPAARSGRFGLGKATAAKPAVPAEEAVPLERAAESSLHQALAHLDESFSESLLRRIDQSGMTDAECYKKAGVDRKLFSKIRGDRLYRPAKITAVAFALALELSPADAEDLLRKAGFALSHSNKFDVIVEYCIAHGVYDRMAVNQALYEFDQPLLGA